MFWIILSIIVFYILFRFFSDLKKDKIELQDVSLENKFGRIIEILNDFAYNGEGEIIKHNYRTLTIYKSKSNRIIRLMYSTGHLTIYWGYKFFQKEVKLEKQFNDVRNISLAEQELIARETISNIESVVQKHQIKIMQQMLDMAF